MPNYTRPGVEASARLAKIRNTSIWDAIERQYGAMIEMKGGSKLRQLDATREALGKKLQSEKNPFLCTEDLFQVVEWKFGKGKPRHALWKHLKSIKDNELKEASRSAFQKAKEGDVKSAIEDLSKLSGVGPATASAVLSIYRPELFAFMDDEIIECLYDGKRGYTIKIYLDINSKCCEIADELGAEWSCSRVGRGLWTASRICATGGKDLTKDDQIKDAGDTDDNGDEKGSRNRSQRSRKQASKEKTDNEALVPDVATTKRRKTK